MGSFWDRIQLMGYGPCFAPPVGSQVLLHCAVCPSVQDGCWELARYALNSESSSFSSVLHSLIPVHLHNIIPMQTVIIIVPDPQQPKTIYGQPLVGHSWRSQLWATLGTATCSWQSQLWATLGTATCRLLLPQPLLSV